MEQFNSVKRKGGTTIFAHCNTVFRIINFRYNTIKHMKINKNSVEIIQNLQDVNLT